LEQKQTQVISFAVGQTLSPQKEDLPRQTRELVLDVFLRFIDRNGENKKRNDDHSKTKNGGSNKSESRNSNRRAARAGDYYCYLLGMQPAGLFTSLSICCGSPATLTGR